MNHAAFLARWREHCKRDEMMRAMVLTDFEVTDSPKDTVRRMVVANAVAKRLGVKVVNTCFVGFVNRVVAGLGAEHTRPHNRRMWRKLRRRVA